MTTKPSSSRKPIRFTNVLPSRLVAPGLRVIAIALLAAACVASSQTVPSLMNYQGKLIDAVGDPMPNGSYDLIFKISKHANPADPADALVWGQTNTVTVINGIFNVVLGTENGIIRSASRTSLVDAFDEAQRYLSLSIVRNPAGPVVSPAEILPRQQMLSAPYALKTAVATDAVNAYNGVPPGCILPFGGTNVPNGFFLCDGTAVSRSAYSNLFFAIGTAWGAGDGFNTFNLPDMRGYFLRGVDSTPSADRDPDYAGRTALKPGGNTGRNVGSVQSDDFKSHTHAQTGGPTTQNLANGSNIAIPHNTTSPTGATGGNETRPKNVYVNYVIKY